MPLLHHSALLLVSTVLCLQDVVEEAVAQLHQLATATAIGTAPLHVFTPSAAEAAAISDAEDTPRMQFTCSRPHPYKPSMMLWVKPIA
jgi:hypothetical protein